MSAPSISLNVIDGGLGSAGANTDRLVAVFGCSSAGSVGSLTYYTNPATLIGDYGYGPGVSLACHIMATSGQGVIFGKAVEDVAPGFGPVSHSGTGTSVATTGGTPYDGIEVVITVTSGGTIGTDVCRATVSLDNGVTSIGTYQIPGSSLVIPKTGVTVTFGAGTLVAGDTYSFATTPPESNSLSGAGSIVDNIALLPAYAASHAGSYPTLIADADVRDAAAVTAIQTAMESLATGYEYARCVTSVESPSNYGTIALWSAAIVADFASTDAIRVSVGAGLVHLFDATIGAYVYRPTTFPIVARLASTKVHIDPAWVSLGGVPGVRELVYDERIDGGLDAARFSTMTTFVGLSGYYITNCHLLAPPASDYQLIQYGRVMDKICRYTYGYFLQSLSQSVRLNPATGRILEADAQGLEAGNNARLAANVIADGNASSAVTTVSRTDNLATPGATFHASVAVVPLGYLKHIAIDLFFVNPAA